MWEDSRYFWVVLCKYKWFHIRESLSLFFRYRIALGETDPGSPCPVVSGSFLARCDKCGQEASYKASEVLRFELNEPPESFTPHPLFRAEDEDTESVVTAPTSIRANANTDSLRRSVLERMWSKVVLSLGVRQKESPPPYWRRPPQDK
jgi:hypothetical protein